MSVRKNKIGPARAREMTTQEIERAIFAGARTNEHRGISDAFTDSALVVIAEAEYLSGSVRDWAVSALCPID